MFEYPIPEVMFSCFQILSQSLHRNKLEVGGF